jgi:hypothetical protein
LINYGDDCPQQSAQLIRSFSMHSLSFDSSFAFGFPFPLHRLVPPHRRSMLARFRQIVNDTFPSNHDRRLET